MWEFRCLQLDQLLELPGSTTELPELPSNYTCLNCQSYLLFILELLYLQLAQLPELPLICASILVITVGYSYLVFVRMSHVSNGRVSYYLCENFINYI